MTKTTEHDDWQATACILCSLNCGIRVQRTADGRGIARVRGDDTHPGSRGYLCNKASRLDYYQNGADRLFSPLKRTPAGDYEPIDWDTAISEIARKLAAIRDEHGGDRIFYYGGGGQGNHLAGGYARTSLQPLGVTYRSNALAQEKTGEFWVAHRMFGGWPHGDFEHAQVAVFLGKNPWHSHGIPRARVTLREIARDPDRTLIVIDPKRTETADLADLHLAVRPGRDAWLLAGMVATVVQEGLANSVWLDSHARGTDAVIATFSGIDIRDCAEKSGIEEDTLRATARLIARADSVAVLEDLGVQMNRHSTLVSYLQRLLWTLTGHFGRPGTHYTALGLGNLAAGPETGTSPVAGARLINGLVPCNVICDEILTDHPARYRAMIIESGNPVHSLADSPRWREAMRALELSVVIDIAMTETARQADYVLPTTSQFEKAEATFFAMEFPENHFHVRHPVFPAPEGPLDEAEIHMRLAESLGAVPEGLEGELRAILAEEGRDAFRETVFAQLAKAPQLAAIGPGLLYRTLGAHLPDGMQNAAALWAVCHTFAAGHREAVEAAGFNGDGPALGEALFDALVSSESGVVICREDWSAVEARLPGGRIELELADLLADAARLSEDVPRETSREFPFLLSAGERRAYTANTIIRNPDWRKKATDSTLHIHPEDAARLNLGEGSRATVSTRRGTAEVLVTLSERMQPGHVALPNGTGLAYPDADGRARVHGPSPNELTSVELRDEYVGTPWHKSVPARIEPAV